MTASVSCGSKPTVGLFISPIIYLGSTFCKVLFTISIVPICRESEGKFLRESLLCPKDPPADNPRWVSAYVQYLEVFDLKAFHTTQASGILSRCLGPDRPS